MTGGKWGWQAFALAAIILIASTSKGVPGGSLPTTEKYVDAKGRTWTIHRDHGGTSAGYMIPPPGYTEPASGKLVERITIPEGTSREYLIKLIEADAAVKGAAFALSSAKSPITGEFGGWLDSYYTDKTGRVWLIITNPVPEWIGSTFEGGKYWVTNLAISKSAVIAAIDAGLFSPLEFKP